MSAAAYAPAPLGGLASVRARRGTCGLLRMQETSEDVVAEEGPKLSRAQRRMEGKKQKKNTDGSSKATQQVRLWRALKPSPSAQRRARAACARRCDAARRVGLLKRRSSPDCAWQATGGMRTKKQKQAGPAPNLVEVAWADEVPPEVRHRAPAPAGCDDDAGACVRPGGEDLPVLDCPAL